MTLRVLFHLFRKKFRNNYPQCTIILGGDFNAGDIDWKSHTVIEHSQKRQINEKVLSVILNSGLSQIQIEPTRQNKILDLLCTNKPGLFSEIHSICGFSDHSIIMADCDLKAQVTKKPPRTITIWNKADWGKIKGLTESFSAAFMKKAQGRSVNENYAEFAKFITDVATLHIPTKQSSTQNDLPWFSRELKRMCRKKKRRRIRAVNKSQKKDDWDDYLAYQKTVNEAQTDAHWNYVNNILQNSLEEKNSKPFWKYIKSKRNETFGIPSLESNNKMYSDSQSKSEILNSQFKSVFTKITADATPKLPGNNYPSINQLNITLHGVQKLLENINVKKAAGPDNISGKILQTLSSELAPVLHFIFVQSLGSGVLPNEWSLANVSPIFKKGSKHMAENYRPVSLTCITCKLFEHVICKHILKHVESHRILTDLQHGFRSGRSCESQLITTMDDLLYSFDNGRQVDVAVLDFSKAFDTVPHNSLIGKLEHYGIDGKILDWINHFLKNRKQRVVVDGEFSSYATVDSGVPQGTVLGPLLFLLFINDLPSNVHSSKVRLFADDCLVYKEVKTAQDQIDLQKDLSALETWGNLWGMRFNAKKCNILRVTKKGGNPLQRFYTLNNQILQEVPDAKYLGIQIDSNLDWSKHISSIVSRGYSKLGFLRRNLKGCPSKLRGTAYYSLVRPQLEYCSSIWNPHKQFNVSKIEGVQSKAARFVSNKYRRKDSVSKMLQNLEWRSLSDRRLDQRLVTLFKIVKGITFVETEGILREGDGRTRAKNKLKKFKHLPTHLDPYRFSFFPATIRSWNQLPFGESEFGSVEAFKLRVKRHEHIRPFSMPV